MKSYIHFLQYLLIIIISFLFSPLVLAASSTMVNGEIRADTVWTQTNSPYVISGVVSVDKGATLTVNPGTIVKFEQNTSLTVEGTLVGAGTPTSPIYFTSIADDKVGGDTNKDKSASSPSPNNAWNIDFINASSSMITNAIVRYNNGGLFVLNSSVVFASTSFSQMNGQVSADNSRLAFTNVAFSDMYRGAIDAFATSTVLIASTTVTHSITDAITVYSNSFLSAVGLDVSDESNGAGLTIFNSSTGSCDQCGFSNIANDDGASVSVFSHSSLSLTHSLIKNATGTEATAFQLYDPVGVISSESTHSHALISDTTITATQSGASGVVVFGPVTFTAGNLTVSGFTDDGIEAYNGPNLSIITSTFTKNKNAGIELFGNVSGAVSDSFIYGNGQYGMLSRTNNPFMAAHNWWGATSGPYHSSENPKGRGNAISDNVVFSPWLKSKRISILPPPIDSSTPGTTTPCCSNVLFIPGIEASRLYMNVPLLGEQQLWEPGGQADGEELFLDNQGHSINPVYTRDIIKTTNLWWPLPNIDIYQKFSDFLNGLVSTNTIAAWQAYPYDWRLDPQDLVQNGTAVPNGISKLVSVVESLASTSKTNQITIIAHSNGGILAKLLLNELAIEGKSSLVDKLLLVAVPQLGTPTAIPALLSGYGQSIGDGLILSVSNAQLLGENMPSAYSLLPSASYFALNPAPIAFDPSLAALSDLYQTYGSSITSQSSLIDFLSTANKHLISDDSPDKTLLIPANHQLLTEAAALHSTLDYWQAPQGVSVVQIAGVGINTIAASHYYAITSDECVDVNCQSLHVLDMRPDFTSFGDGTVVATSASALSPNATTTTYYLDLASYNTLTGENRSHSDILEASTTEDLIGDIIQYPLISVASTLPEFVSLNPHSLPYGQEQQISVHSPVVLNIYDNQGHHLGPLSSATSTMQFIQNQIPNSYYFQFGEGTYAGLPAKTVGTITLTGSAVGTFTLDITNDGTTTTFSDIPVLPISRATLVLGTATDTKLSVDFDGDGIPDTTFSPRSNFDPLSYLKSMKKVVAGLNLPAKTTTALKEKLYKVIREFKEENTLAAQKTISKYMKRLYYPKNPALRNALSGSEQQLLVTMLNNILDEIDNINTSK